MGYIHTASYLNVISKKPLIGVCNYCVGTSGGTQTVGTNPFFHCCLVFIHKLFRSILMKCASEYG